MINASINNNYQHNRPLAQNENGNLNNCLVKTYRKQAWKYMLAGGAVFDNLDFTFESNGLEDGNQDPPIGYHGGGPTLRTQLGILNEVFHGLDFINMTPRNDLPKSDGIITNVSPSTV